MPRMAWEDKKRVVELFKQGMNLKEISAETGIAYNNVRNTVTAAGLREVRRLPMKQDYIEELKHLFESGLLLTQIAEKVGLESQTISNWLREDGIIIGKGSYMKRLSEEERAKVGKKISKSRLALNYTWSEEQRAKTMATLEEKNAHLWEDRTCPIDGKKFHIRKSVPQLTCSIQCAGKAKSLGLL